MGTRSLVDTAVFGDQDSALDFIANVLESSTEYSIVAADLGGTIVLWNEGACRIYGFAPEEVVGRGARLPPHLEEHLRRDAPHRRAARHAVLHTLPHRVEHRRPDDHRPPRDHHRRERPDGGPHRAAPRRADRDAVQAVLHRPRPGRGHVSQKLAELLGAEIAVDSEPGEGATFTVALQR